MMMFSTKVYKGRRNPGLCKHRLTLHLHKLNKEAINYVKQLVLICINVRYKKQLKTH